MANTKSRIPISIRLPNNLYDEILRNTKDRNITLQDFYCKVFQDFVESVQSEVPDYFSFPRDTPSRTIWIDPETHAALSKLAHEHSQQLVTIAYTAIKLYFKDVR